MKDYIVVIISGIFLIGSVWFGKEYQTVKMYKSKIGFWFLYLIFFLIPIMSVPLLIRLDYFKI